LARSSGKATAAEIERLAAAGAIKRLWDADPTLFSPDPVHAKSIKSRLGWLRSPALMQSKLGELASFAAEIKAAGFTDAVLLGMGGSSLCPEVLSLTTPPGAGLVLHILDNTDPAAVLGVERNIAGKKTLFVVASKSGGTIEIQAFERYFWQKALDANDGDVARAGAHFVAITDPATRLEKLADEKKYRRVFVNPADIGGRYSALSYFGLVPAALLGANPEGLIASAVEFAAASSPIVPAAANPGLALGAALGTAAKLKRDKLTLVTSPELDSLGSWIEQLVAESTGKDGKGVLPVDLEPLGAPGVYEHDRLFVHVRLGDRDPKNDAALAALERAGHPVIHIALPNREALGREFFRWELATAIAGATLAINPFDEPNVTEAKLATGALLEASAASGQLPQPEDAVGITDVDRIRAHLATVEPGDYLAFCAYFVRTPARDAALTRMRVACRDRSHNPTTLGYGPRFLHSTGQLHKGGPNTGVFLQMVADTPEDMPVPGEPYTFATLRNAQALGDLQVLRRRGRRVLRVQLGADVDAALAAIERALTAAPGSVRKSA
jgi:glucose-6-phosphate isomerase